MKILSNIILIPIWIFIIFFSCIFILFPNYTYDEIVNIYTEYEGSAWKKLKYEWSQVIQWGREWKKWD